MLKGNKKNEGSNNVTAGRDAFVFNSNSHSIELFTDCDKRINEQFPKGFLSPTTNKQSVLFSSEKLFRSLVKLDIPLKQSLSTLQRVCELLLKTGEAHPTTSKIRECIVQALHELGGSDSQRWIDKYARRFGYPDRHIQVLHRDGQVDNLDYKFLKDVFLPHLLSDGLKIDYSLMDKIVSMSELSCMAEEVIFCIRTLDLYTIRYKTLFHLIFDIALQPPHPWFANQPFSSSAIEYDRERSNHHIEMLQSQNEQSIGAQVHHVLEVIHHSCSMILGYYGCFLGIGELAPLYTLARMVKKLTDNEDSLTYSLFHNIEGDLRAIDIQLIEFSMFLDILQKQSSIGIQDGSFETLREKAFRIVDISNRLIITGHQEHQLLQGKVVSADELFSLIVSTIKRISGLEVHEKDDNNRILWVIHDINLAVFREIKPKIAITVLVDANDDAMKMWQSQLKVISENTIHDQFFDTVLVFALTPKIIQKIRLVSVDAVNRFRVIPILSESLCNIVKSPDRDHQLATLIASA